MRQLDASGLVCPLPVLRTRRALKDMAVGELLQVIATDPAAERDMAAFCAATGHRLLSFETRDGVLVFCLEKTG